MKENRWLDLDKYVHTAYQVIIPIIYTKISLSFLLFNTINEPQMYVEFIYTSLLEGNNFFLN